MDTSALLVNFLLFVLLPLWGISGFVDWICHRSTSIETTSGLKESLMHSVMGIQLGIPIILCLTFRVNILVLIICFIAWVLHELVAHWDVSYASDKRRISIWEMHAHSYMASLPLYMFLMILVLHWPVFLDLINFNWESGFELVRLTNPPGGEGYLRNYLIFMSAICVFPYIEENIRCLTAELRKRRAV